jgi:hypothetical protein
MSLGTQAKTLSKGHAEAVSGYLARAGTPTETEPFSSCP